MSTTQEASESRADILQLELYKNLKQESAAYIEKVPALWLQKFILIGGIIAFIFTEKNVPRENLDLLTLGVAAIPALALLLDAKILEYGLHARLISRFVSDTFRHDGVLSGWEELFWGISGPSKDLVLARIRSLTTVVVVVLPSCVIIILSAAVLGRLHGQFSLFVTVGMLVCGVYILLSVYIWNLIWPRRR
ncbi:MAG TPA: hypothetical protein VNI02_09545 [Blastocatellia bacterium]|jgi:hypothetical protein|nr:hypothetical protein [Blastocatellia bacterium]